MEAALTSDILVSYHTSRCHNPEDGGSMDLWNVGILAQYNRTRCHNPEDLDSKETKGVLRIRNWEEYMGPKSE
jgi:hypothetical protein